MPSDLSFLPCELIARADFKLAWRVATQAVARAAKGDLDLGTKAQKKELEDSFHTTFSAADRLMTEIDHGVFADFVDVDDFAGEYSFSSDDIQTVRRFLNVLRQHTLVAVHDELARIPAKKQKSAARTAAYHVGRICRQFGLGTPTNSASENSKGEKKESVAIKLLRYLLIEGREDSKPSLAKLRSYIKIAKHGFESFKPRNIPHDLT